MGLAPLKYHFPQFSQVFRWIIVFLEFKLTIQLLQLTLQLNKGHCIMKRELFGKKKKVSLVNTSWSSSLNILNFRGLSALEVHNQNLCVPKLVQASLAWV